MTALTGFVLQHQSKAYLAEQCLKVGSKAVKDRNKITALSSRDHLIRKPLERFHILVKEESDGRCHKTVKLRLHCRYLIFLTPPFGSLDGFEKRR